MDGIRILIGDRTSAVVFAIVSSMGFIFKESRISRETDSDVEVHSSRR